MNGLLQKELLRRAHRRTGMGCEPECDNAPLGTPQFNPNRVAYERERHWFVVSSLNPDGTAKAATVFPAGMIYTQGFEFDVPLNMALWSLGVDYPTVDGQIVIGLNNPPIPVRAGVLFNLSTVEFPAPLCGPLKVLIRGGVIPGDPVIPLPVNWYAIVGER